MYKIARTALFSLPPELAHDISLKGISAAERLLPKAWQRQPAGAPVKVMGIEFPSPVGLAAGLDKDGRHIDGLAALGFGFLEVGTVTPRPQVGNPKPRLFRLPAAGAIINRMGFNNHGIDALIASVKSSRYRGVLGINIGKNKDTPADQALDDYLYCMDRAWPLASYITVNLSSPNTPGLRDLQFGEPLKQLLSGLKARQQALAAADGRNVPLVIKVAPDMAREDIAGMAQALIEHGIDGVIAGNTTITRAAVAHLKHGAESGGLSGAPLRELSTTLVKSLAEDLAGAIPIIGVGGIDSGAAAKEKIDAGASLVQIYTGFIYRGPALISEAEAALRASS